MLKKVLLFPGQGAQYTGMGKKLCEEFKTASDIFDEASEAISLDLKKMCFEGQNEELILTCNTQPAILTLSMAMFRVFMEEDNGTPDLLAGHSLGEISALACAGAIEFADAVKIVRKRGELMMEAVAPLVGAMAAVGTRDVNKINEICQEVSNNSEFAWISNYNSRTQTVISGTKGAIERAIQLLDMENIHSKQLNVGTPFHCILMKPAAEQFQVELSNYTFHDLKYPVLSNVTANLYNGKEDIIKNLTSQIVMPVQWVRSMDYLKLFKIEYGIEIGPGNVLKNLMKTNHAEIKIFTYDNEADIEEYRSFVKKSYIPFLSRSLGIAVSTRNLNWNSEEYRSGVVEPYNKISALQEKVEQEDRRADFEEMKQAVDMLKTMFQTKKTSIEEQMERFKELFQDTGTEQLFKDFDYSGLR